MVLNAGFKDPLVQNKSALDIVRKFYTHHLKCPLDVHIRKIQQFDFGVILICTFNIGNIYK